MRSTKAEKAAPVSQELLDDVAEPGVVEHRGSTYRLDTYPVGGALICGDLSGWLALQPPKWPYKNFQDNLKPH